MHLKHSDIQAISAVLRELYAHTHAPTLPHCLVRLLHLLIPSNSAVYNSFNFRTGEMQVVHDHGPDGDKYLPALQQHIQEHPLLAYVRAHWQDGAAALSDVVSQRELRDTGIYCEFLHPLHIERQLGLMVEDRHYGVTAVALQRDGLNFSARDKAVLTFLQPHIIQSFKNAADITAARQQVSGMNVVLAASDLGIVWLSHKEKIEWQSNRAEGWLRGYFPASGNADASTLPAALKDWIHRQKAGQESNGSLGWRSEKTIPGPDGELKVCWISEPPERSYLILSERRHCAPRSLHSLGVTAREAEVLDWVAEGKTNEAISILLGLSKRTVEKHVERILAKLGVETRVEAALLVAERKRE
ncbi:MAG TPA: helix-turn-helix transcriptional regulator [Verrucomicrobiae bacterium]|nr:helix-turn-helix transcriptional regulator [Verrucomicrobiae bacterium]